MKQTYENNKRRIQTFKLTADVKDDNGVVHHFFEGYEYVEIGGIKWATCNVGAENETDSGLYFAWGETQGYTADQVGRRCGQKCFAWYDYKFGTLGNLLKYNIADGLTKLEPCDDAATQNIGSNWRMPTREEFDALLSATTNKWRTVNGVEGKLFTDKTDESKKLFFPAVSYCCYGIINNIGFYGYYWSSSLDTSYAIGSWDLSFLTLDCYISYGSRCLGFPVRGVIAN